MLTGQMWLRLGSSHGISCDASWKLTSLPFPAFYSLPGHFRCNLPEKMEHQFYQPLSAALHAPLQSSHASQPQHYSSYASHATSSTTTTNGAPQHSQQREEEEEEEDDEEIVEEELDQRDQQSPNTTSPRVAAVHPSKSAGCVHFTDAPEDLFVML